MTSMYSYPRVARCPPESIQLPACMYKIEPIAHKALVGDSLSNGSGNSEDQSLVQILAAQERLIHRLQRIEDGFVQLSLGQFSDLSIGTSQIQPQAKLTKVSYATPNQNEAIESIIQRQEKLIQQIDQLSESLRNSVTISAPKLANSTPITKQIATDVSVFVEMGSSIRQLYKFLQWLRDEKKLKVLLRTHYHSSTVGLNRTTDWTDFTSKEIYWRTEYDVTVTLIVTHAEGAKHQLRSFIDPVHGTVTGEEQIIRLIGEKLAVDYKQ